MSPTLSALRAAVERSPVAYPASPGLCAWRVGNRVGESPVWCVQTGTLLWIEVRAPALLRLNPATNVVTRWALPEVVGAIGLAAEAGSVVLALRRSLALLDTVSGTLTPLQTVDGEPAHNRLNDGKVSPSGRWFVFGSMDDGAIDKQPTGALYCAERGGAPRRLLGGLTVANGIAFSPDGARLYFSDSHQGRVWHAPWSERDGAIGTPQLLCSADETAGRPDGAAVDAGGRYWSAGVSAGCLNRYQAGTGAVLQRVMLPLRAPTMPCFGGAGLADLYVTSLVRPGWTPAAGELDGALLCWPSGTSGLPAPRWG